MVTRGKGESHLKGILGRIYFLEKEALIKQKNDQEKQEKSAKNEKFF